MSSPSHRSASAINLLARKAYPKRLNTWGTWTPTGKTTDRHGVTRQAFTFWPVTIPDAEAMGS